MTGKHILVLDIGTSSAKAVLFDLAGHVKAESDRAYPTRTLPGGLQEQDPLDWWTACVRAAGELGDLSSVEAVSLTGTMQSVIPLDAHGEPVRAALLYSDSRAEATFHLLASRFEALRAGSVVGNHVNEFMAVFKMAWMKQHEPRLFDAVSMFHSGAKDYVIYRLTGTHVTDATAATTVGLMDIRARAWALALADAAGISMQCLPRIERADAVVGEVTVQAARNLGIRAGVPVINGCGDAGAATLGAGVSRPGQVYVYLGTSAWVALVRDIATLSLPNDLYTLAHPASSLAIRIGAMLCGGDSVAWWREAVHHDFRLLEDQLGQVDREPPDALFLPYLKGERCPFHDPRLRGAFLGLDRSHRPAHLLYAVLEGVGLALRANMDALGIGGGEIRLIGGGAESAIWPQLIADICARPVVVNEIPTAATAFGAFNLAAGQLGATTADARWSRTVSPRGERIARSERRRHLFDEATRFAREFAQRLQ